MPITINHHYLKRQLCFHELYLSCGTVLIQHKEPTCISFTCRYDDSVLAMYSIMSIGIPYRDPVNEFLGNKQGNIYKKLLLYIEEISI